MHQYVHAMVAVNSTLMHVRMHMLERETMLDHAAAPACLQINMRGDLPDDYRKRHPTAPKRVQWVSGVLLPPGVQPTNGTWGPRWSW